MLYFDNCATTRVDDAVQTVVDEYNRNKYYNPSSPHKFSLSVLKDISQAKNNILSLLKGEGDIIFTSGGTEANNLALSCVLGTKKGNIVLSAGEHSSVFNFAQSLTQKGYEIKVCPLLADGSIDIQAFAALIDGDTLLAAVMHVNNETGAINDIARAAKILKNVNPRALFFADGIQAVGKIEVNLKALGVDLYSFSGHKIHAPKGVGGLYAAKGVKITPMIFGGGQQEGKRSGTENVSGMIALSKAFSLAFQNMQKNTADFNEYASFLTESFQKLGGFKRLCLNSSSAVYSCAFFGVESQVLLNMLEGENIVVGLGSACNGKNVSRVIKEINLDKNYRQGVIRIGFSKFNDAEQVKVLADGICKFVREIRKVKGVII